MHAYIFSEQTFTDICIYTQIHVDISYLLLNQDSKQSSIRCQNAAQSSYS